MFGTQFDPEQDDGFGSFKADSPRFAGEDSKDQKRDNASPIFGEILPKFNHFFLRDPEIQKQKEETLKTEKLRVLSSFQNRLTKLVAIFNKKVISEALSEGFCRILLFSSRSETPQLDTYLYFEIQSKLKAIGTLLHRKSKLLKQYSYNKILQAVILIQNDAFNHKKLQNIDTRRYHQILLKQNDDRDNASALEIQNTFLKKELLKEDRQQNTFIEAMKDLLDQHDVHHEANHTHRPYLTSFCSSPDAFQGRRKFVSNAGEKKMKTIKKH